MQRDSLSKERGHHIEVVPVTSRHWTTLATLFTAADFTRECWCMWPRLAPGAYCPGAATYREDLHALVNSGNPPGLIGLRGGRAVGWCAVGQYGQYPQYAPQSDGAMPGRNIWAIPCLFVAADARGSGVAGALIRAAADHASSLGATAILGPPPWWLPGDAAAVAATAAAFLANGFTKIGAGARMPLLRRDVVQ